MTPFGASPWDDPLTYASGWPEHSCWLRGDRLDDLGPLDAALAGRHAVLAVGSNGSPAQLHRKLTRADVPVDLPLLRVEARSLEPVHLAWVAPYGALPTTAASGRSSELVLTLLDDEQLAAIDQTEGAGYTRPRLDPERHGVVEVVSGRAISEVSCYVPRGDVLVDPGSGEPVVLRRQRDLWVWLLAAIPGMVDLCGATPEEATARVATDPQRRAALSVLLIRAGATAPVSPPATRPV